MAAVSKDFKLKKSEFDISYVRIQSYSHKPFIIYIYKYISLFSDPTGTVLAWDYHRFLFSLPLGSSRAFFQPHLSFKPATFTPLRRHRAVLSWYSAGVRKRTAYSRENVCGGSVVVEERECYWLVEQLKGKVKRGNMHVLVG